MERRSQSVPLKMNSDSESDSDSNSESPNMSNKNVDLNKSTLTNSFLQDKVESNNMESDNKKNTNGSKTGGSKLFKVGTILLVCSILILSHYTYSRVHKYQNNMMNGPNKSDVKLFDWWEIYDHECCTTNNKGINDCNTNEICQQYLDMWLNNYNQNFNTSKLTNKCCYEHRNVGAKKYDTYCSYTCLNTGKKVM